MSRVVVRPVNLAMAHLTNKSRSSCGMPLTFRHFDDMFKLQLHFLPLCVFPIQHRCRTNNLNSCLHQIRAFCQCTTPISVLLLFIEEIPMPAEDEPGIKVDDWSSNSILRSWSSGRRRNHAIRCGLRIFTEADISRCLLLPGQSCIHVGSSKY